MQPGGHATFSIKVWFRRESGAGDSVTVTIVDRPKRFATRITGCHLSGRQTCRRISKASYSVAGMSVNQSAELTAEISVPKHAKRKSVILVARASSTAAPASVKASASESIIKPSPSPSPTPTGVGTTLPPLPAGSGGTGLPALPTPGNPGSAFPTLSPTPVTLPGARHARLTNVSATVPLDMRLIGGQLAGLAVLAAAVTIAVARLSLRKPQAETSTDERADAT